MPSIRTWKEGGSASVIEYSAEAIERLRELAVDGLLSLPRFGMGVGGILLGVREPGRIRILDSSPIPCSHALGPAFDLTPEEKITAEEMVRTAGPLAVVGCYFSKTREWPDLNATDRELFGMLCPERWQLMLLIKPSTVEESRVAVCYRDITSAVRRGMERTLSVLEIEPEVPPQPEAPREPAPPQPRAPAFTQLAKTASGVGPFGIVVIVAMVVTAAIAALLEFR